MGRKAGASLSSDQCVLMSLVIASIGSQDPAQMGFAPDDEMIEALAPDRSDQPFSEAILPRCTWCDGLVPYAHGTQTAGDNGAVDAIPIANNVVRGLVPREPSAGGECP